MAWESAPAKKAWLAESAKGTANKKGGKNEVGKAIGKKGTTIKKLSDKLKKKIEIYGYAKDPKTFLQKAFKEVSFEKLESTELDGKKLIEARLDASNKRKMLTQSKKLNRIKELLQRNYNVFDVKIN